MSNQVVLLLNASNMDSFPVYPYAFIQVPAVARRFGIEVNCKDLLGIPQDSWRNVIQQLITRHQPAMILITLRNTDSLSYSDYDRGDATESNETPYFPIEQTKSLITTLREITNLKITLGGFGFSLLAHELMHYLRPDIGVFGEPESFFEHFEDVQRGEYAHVANLLFFHDGQLVSNPRSFFPPLARAEYNSQAIHEMIEFYESFPSPGFQGAPIEIMRGCCHTCIFCAEPHVAGSRVRYRDLSAVMEDIKILVDHGINQIYIISSELNPQGNEFVLQLAERIRFFNQQQVEDRQVRWFGANYLLNFGPDEYHRLYSSGFTGGWFDITALDDENARAMRTPYRNERLLTDLKVYQLSEKWRFERLAGRETSNLEDQLNQSNPKRKATTLKWTMFLGNPATTIQTIRNTLRLANQEGLAQDFEACFIIKSIRVFDYEKLDKATLAVSNSINLDLERVGYQQILPSFAYPPALLKHFGSVDEIVKMFDHIAETYLSTKYQENRDWYHFIKQETTSATILGWIDELSGIQGKHFTEQLTGLPGGIEPGGLQELFTEDAGDEDRLLLEIQAKDIVESLISTCMEAFPEIFQSLDFPSTMDNLERVTPYELATALFSKWAIFEQLFEELAELLEPGLNERFQDYIQFCIQATLYRFNTQIKPQYKDLFIPSDL